MQACLEEKNGKGLLLFLDLEKHVDRVSHEYQMEALRAARVERKLRLWISIIYSEHDPMRGGILLNGHLSTESSQ